MSVNSSGGSVLDVENVRSRVSESVISFVDDRSQLLNDVDPHLDDLHVALLDFLNEGKRLRPAFCWWGWRAAGGADEDGVIQAAASLELLQACALIHDDVMDGSDTRRNAPSIHRRMATEHANAGWRGDSDNFGVAAAILLGDICLSWTDEMYSTADLSIDILQRGRPYLDVMRTEVMAGQYLDVVAQARAEADSDLALRVATFKSAKYTIERPLQLGAAMFGGDDKLLAGLSNYGLPLGEAFQLRDDLLGVYGDPEVTGKPAGDDLREGKRTYLVTKALQLATLADAATLDTLLGDPELDTNGINQARELIADTGAGADVERLIAERTEQALESLDTVDIDPQARRVLSDLAVAATVRAG